MIYEIKFSHGESNVFVTATTEFTYGANVIIKNQRGKFFGQILRRFEEGEIEAEGNILSLALEQDYKWLARLEEKSQEAKKTVKKLVADSNLSMKVIDVSFSFDDSQLFISFSADERVDFRQLLKDLAEEFHTRIELRQIGVRDAAKLFSGLGPCGRPLCCAEFIYDFPAVSIKMAKNQFLSLNQAKLNGLCGRLMCCLAYEDDFYKEARRRFPDFGDHFETPYGKGQVIGMNILKETVKLRFDETIKELKLSEIEVEHA